MGRKPKALIEAIANASTHENTSPLKIEKTELKKSKKISKDKRVIVRRSGRLQSLVRSSQDQENHQTMVEQINIVESEKEDEQQDAGKEDQTRDEREVEVHEEREVESDKEHTPEPTPSKSSLEDKIDLLVQTVEQLKDEVTEIRPSTNLIHKSLDLDSKKKIEALTDENHQLSKKLEIALLKLEAHEGVKEMYNKMMKNVTKANDALLSLTSQAALSKLSPVAAAARAKPPSAYKKRKTNEGLGYLTPQASTAEQAKVSRKKHSKAQK